MRRVGSRLISRPAAYPAGYGAGYPVQGKGSQIPANAIKLRDGSYLVDRSGNYVVTR